jgi:hypothetical protein
VHLVEPLLSPRTECDPHLRGTDGGGYHADMAEEDRLAAREAGQCVWVFRGGEDANDAPENAHYAERV